MKTAFTFFFGLLSLIASSQVKTKTIEKDDGTYTYCYHSNGKVSTEEFRPKSNAYIEPGYSKAYDSNGNLIYEEASSRRGQISGTTFWYYESGAVRKAEYSSHPDAGIQWYRKFVYFDEEGNITDIQEQSHDMTATIVLPDTTRERLEQEREHWKKQQELEKERQKREQFVKDSTAFYLSTEILQEDGTVIEYHPDPQNGRRTLVTKKGKKIISSTTEYFDKTKGIQTIKRTYHKNGLIREEFIYEPGTWHYREYDKKGRLIVEKLNQKWS